MFQFIFMKRQHLEVEIITYHKKKKIRESHTFAEHCLQKFNDI